MKKIFQRIDQIRASGHATLNLQKSSPYFDLNGRRFPVVKMASPAIKCKVTLLISNAHVEFLIDEIL